MDTVSFPVNPRQALETFLTPPRAPEFSWETRLLAQAATHRVRLGPNGFARGGDVDVQVYTWGAGPAVLFVHGWGGNAGNHAAGIKAVVQAGGQAIAFDAPGHGHSDGTFSSAPAFAWAIQALAAQQPGGFRGIVAHSLGGGATCIALGRGVRAQYAVLLAASCRVEPILLDFAARQGYSPKLTAALRRIAAAEFGPEEASAEHGAAGLQNVPVLLMHDPEDREIPFFHSEAIAAAWPGAVLERVSKVGHRSILRSQAVVAATCRHALTGPSGSAA